MIDGTPKIEVKGLKKHFPINESIISQILRRGEQPMLRAVDGVDLAISEGEAVGLAGESGCGKTTLGKTMLRIIDPTEGRIFFDGEDITEMGKKGLNRFRRDAQLVHQDPFNSINPRYTVFKWVREPLVVQKIGTKAEQEERVYQALELAGLRPPEAFVDKLPSELSGGERQRVGIARVLSLEPNFIVADEPASMLDVSIRASILDTFNRLQEEQNLTSLYISHDLSLLKYMCDKIAIMYLGEVVEFGPAADIINDPKHPYTKALVSSVPIIDTNTEREQIQLQGRVPDPVDKPAGCAFHPRCPEAIEGECDQRQIPTIDVGSREVNCILYE